VERRDAWKRSCGWGAAALEDDVEERLFTDVAWRVVRKTLQKVESVFED
jgi:hypothetical protein